MGHVHLINLVTLNDTIYIHVNLVKNILKAANQIFNSPLWFINKAKYTAISVIIMMMTRKTTITTKLIINIQLIIYYSSKLNKQHWLKYEAILCLLAMHCKQKNKSVIVRQSKNNVAILYKTHIEKVKVEGSSQNADNK